MVSVRKYTDLHGILNEIAFHSGLEETFNMFFISPYGTPSLPVYSAAISGDQAVNIGDQFSVTISVFIAITSRISSRSPDSGFVTLPML